MEFWYETHMHTMESSGCGRNTGAEQARHYKKLGYQGIIVTDHFINGYTAYPKNGIPWDRLMDCFIEGYLSAKEEGDRIGLDVFLGWEFTIRGSDFLTYGLDFEFLLDNPNLDRLEIEPYSELVRKSGGFLAQAHPYRDRAYIQHRLPVSHLCVDAIEVHNASDPASTNKKALEFAKKHNLPVQAGGDSHGVSDTPSGIKLKRRAETIHDIIEAIKNEEVGLILSK